MTYTHSLDYTKPHIIIKILFNHGCIWMRWNKIYATETVER